MKAQLMQLSQNLKPDQLPDPYCNLSKKLGMDVVIAIAAELGGQLIYFPKLERILKESRNEIIRKEFNGYNYSALAKKYSLSTQWIRKIVLNKEI